MIVRSIIIINEWDQLSHTKTFNKYISKTVCTRYKQDGYIKKNIWHSKLTKSTFHLTL